MIRLAKAGPKGIPACSDGRPGTGFVFTLIGDEEGLTHDGGYLPVLNVFSTAYAPSALLMIAPAAPLGDYFIVR